MKFSRDKIYFDYAATTPMDPLVKKAMEPYFFEKFGNPSSIHSFGQEAMAIVDESREKIANIIGASPVGGFQEIIFTGSATEANNLALRGIIKKFRIKNLELRDPLYSKSYILNPRIIVSAIEHESILETCRDLEKDGIEIIYLPVNKQGIVDLNKLKESLNERTILVSVMYANNEIGTIQPISAIAEIVKEFRIKNLEFRNKKNPQSSILNPQFYPLFHTDAVQAFQFLDCDINKLWVDLMTLSGHKIYGPKGIGLLYAKNLEFRIKDLGIKNKKILNPQSSILNPLITGGGQEFDLRSGTENVSSIAGFSKAIELADKNREKETKRISELSDYFWREIKKIFPKIEINGFKIPARGEARFQRHDLRFRIPNIINICFPDQKADELLMKLDLNGIAVSSGSACSARASKSSHVLKAIGLPKNKIKNSLRFSFGKFTVKKDINKTIKIFKTLF